MLDSKVSRRSILIIKVEVLPELSAGLAKIRDIAYRFGIDSESVLYRRIDTKIDSG